MKFSHYLEEVVEDTLKAYKISPPPPFFSSIDQYISRFYLPWVSVIGKVSVTKCNVYNNIPLGSNLYMYDTMRLSSQ